MACSKNSMEETPPKNPLLISVIVSKVFEHVSPEVNNLKGIRLVCKLWHDLSLAQFRNKATVKFVPVLKTKDPSKEHDNHLQVKGTKMIDYLKIIKEGDTNLLLENLPFSRFNFSGVTISFKECFNAQGEMKEFWEVVGRNAEFVEWNACRFVLGGGVTIHHFLAECLPNLKQLKITNGSNGSVVQPQCFSTAQFTQMEGLELVEWPHLNNHRVVEEPQPQCERVLDQLKKVEVHNDMGYLDGRDLLAATPNLETIKICGWNDFTEIIHSVVSLKRVSMDALPHLKHLDLINSSEFHCDDYDRDELMEDLMNSGIRLESFTARLCPRDNGDGEDGQMLIFNYFLASQANSLQILKLFRPPIFSPAPGFLKVKCMTALKELHLWGNIVDNFEFLKHTPSLEVLEIDLQCLGKGLEIQDFVNRYEGLERAVRYQPYNLDLVQCSRETEMRHVRLENLKTLRIDYGFQQNSWNLLGKWMPSVEKLETVLTEQTVPTVCELWKDLKELRCLHGSRIDNSCVVQTENGKMERNTISGLKCK